jgi:hypothetical protein
MQCYQAMADDSSLNARVLTNIVAYMTYVNNVLFSMNSAQ